MTVQAVFLPEASDYLSHGPEESRSLCTPVDKSVLVLGLQESAKKHSIPVSVGVHEPSDDPNSNKLKNTQLWIDEKGNIAQRYQKIHLFDMDQENGPSMKESDSVEPGQEIIKPFDTVIGKIGSSICFDLRFSELALHNKRNGATVLIYPSAFHPDTGRLHWMPLLQARAIESLCYVIAAGQVGVHNENRSSWGHSVVISPWGEILQEASGEWKGEPEVLIADIDQALVDEKRKGLPQGRRT
jgi:predicted amidohydrolase